MWEPETTQFLEQCDAAAARLRWAAALSPGARRKIREHVRVELTYTSSAIEGNRLSWLETLVVLEGQTVPGQPLRDHLEASDHAEAINAVRAMAERSTPLGVADVLGLHALVVRRSLPGNAGRWRTSGVGIKGSEHVPPEAVAVPTLMDEWLQSFNKPIPEHGVAWAARLHSVFLDVHPFADGNGRTARLLGNVYLLRHGHCPALFEAEERLAYFAALEEARGGRPDRPGSAVRGRGPPHLCAVLGTVRVHGQNATWGRAEPLAGIPVVATAARILGLAMAGAVPWLTRRRWSLG